MCLKFSSAIFLLSYTLLWTKTKSDFTYHRFSEKCMGTNFTLLIDHENREFAQIAAKKAFSEAHRLDNILSDYNSESELSKLSQNSGSSKYYSLSNDLFNVLAESDELAVETEGAFDITVGPFSRLWRIARFKNTLPSNNKLLQARKRVGYRKLEIDREKKMVKLDASAMVLDLGGIAKGYAADQMLKILQNLNVRRVLIDAGGDVLLGDPPLGKSGWHIEIGGTAHPDLPTLTISNIAVATSGDFEQSIKLGGKTFSHLINPFTGIGLTSQSQVTVVAPTAMEADSLASACLVLGPIKGFKMLETKQNVIAYFLKKEENETKLFISKKWK